METTVKLKHIRQSSSKVRFVLKQINGMKVDAALNKLSCTNKKASNFIIKGIKSAISNLSNSSDEYNQEKLFISNAYVNQGPTMKRFRPAAMGRAMPIRKRTSHLIITVSDSEKE